MRLLKACLLACFFIVGCGGDDDGGAGACFGGGISPDDQACFNCMQANCDSELTACYGSSWDTGAIGGACADFANCVCDCAETDQACIQACLPQLSQACADCSQPVSDCQDTSCSTECT